MTRLHFIVTRKGDKVSLAYAGESGAQADAAYDGAKGCDSVEHYRFPQPQRVRTAEGASRETVIRTGKPVAEPKKP